MSRLLALNGLGFSKPKHATFDQHDPKFWAANCIKLANYLEAKPESSHDQGSWAEPNSEAPCGTRACALGWAALANLLPGLQYVIRARDEVTQEEVFLSAYLDKEEKEEHKLYCQSYFPTVNGQVMEDWESVGLMYFGRFVRDNVFLDTDRDKDGTVAALRYCAKMYKNGNEPYIGEMFDILGEINEDA